MSIATGNGGWRLGTSLGYQLVITVEAWELEVHTGSYDFLCWDD
jgi:hypothetical protein